MNVLPGEKKAVIHIQILMLGSENSKGQNTYAKENRNSLIDSSNE